MYTCTGRTENAMQKVRIVAVKNKALSTFCIYLHDFSWFNIQPGPYVSEYIDLEFCEELHP